MINYTKTAQTEDMQVHAPNIGYQYGERTSTLSGETFTQNTVHATETTGNEQSFVNNFSEATPQMQESIGTGVEQYTDQDFNFDQFNMLAGDEFNNNGMMMIDADERFELADLGNFQNSFMTLKQPETIYNQDMTLSKTGFHTLCIMEGIKFYYYNDKDPSAKTDPPSGNCTFGLGHLVQTGPCGNKLGKVVSEQEVRDAMTKDIAKAEKTVRDNIKKVKLTQAKFDALVCFTFNEGKQKLLDQINEGASDQFVSDHILTYDTAINRKTGLREEQGGLLKRCEWEAVAFGYKGPFYKNLTPPNPTWGPG